MRDLQFQGGEDEILSGCHSCIEIDSAAVLSPGYGLVKYPAVNHDDPH